MADTAKKLLVKSGDRVLLTGAPAAAESMLGPLPDGALVVARGPAEVTVVFAADEAAFERAMPSLREAARSGRAVWLAYPKLTSRLAGTLNRDRIRDRLEADTDVTPVTQVAIDETWSALRIRPKEQVGH